MKKDFLSIKDLSPAELIDLLRLTAKLKKSPGKFSSALKGKTLALIFEKPSNRTYVSFQVGMYELGGNSIYLGPEHIKLGVRESVHDVAKTLSRYVHAIVLRTFAHETVAEMAKYSSASVINGLSDLLHPCQALADIFTVQEKFGRLKGITMAYIGDGNNVCHSLLYACSKTGMSINVATPEGYEPDNAIVREAMSFADKSGSKIKVMHSVKEAAVSADVLYTDVWASMGQEEESEKRRNDFKGFQVNAGLLKLAKPKALVMHCLPAHRGEEISAEVIDSSCSVVFDQAENRLHAQKAVLIKLLGN